MIARCPSRIVTWLNQLREDFIVFLNKILKKPDGKTPLCARGGLLEGDRDSLPAAHLAPGLDQDLRQVAFAPCGPEMVALSVSVSAMSPLLDKVAFALVPAPDRADLHRRGQTAGLHEKVCRPAERGGPVASSIDLWRCEPRWVARTLGLGAATGAGAAAATGSGLPRAARPAAGPLPLWRRLGGGVVIDALLLAAVVVLGPDPAEPLRIRLRRRARTIRVRAAAALPFGGRRGAR